MPVNKYIWGIEDGSKRVIGTTFRPRSTKVKNQELETRLLLNRTKDALAALPPQE